MDMMDRHMDQCVDYAQSLGKERIQSMLDAWRDAWREQDFDQMDPYKIVLVHGNTNLWNILVTSTQKL